MFQYSFFLLHAILLLNIILTMNVASCDILGVDTRRRRPTHKKTKKKFFIYISKSRPHAFFLLLFNVISVAAIRRKVVIYFKFFGYRLVNQPRIK